MAVQGGCKAGIGKHRPKASPPLRRSALAQCKMVNLGQVWLPRPTARTSSGTRHGDCLFRLAGQDAQRRRETTMSISRGEFRVLIAAALAFRSHPAEAGG